MVIEKSISDATVLEVRLLHRSGLTCRDVAKQCGVSESYVSRIVRNDTRLPEARDDPNQGKRIKNVVPPEAESITTNTPKRRPNRAGSIFWNKTQQRWHGQLQTTLGKRRTVTGATREEVEEKIRNLQRDGDLVPPSREQLEKEKHRVKAEKEARKAKIKAKAKQLGVPASRSISTRLRFTILERDNFTCRYCGRKAPDVTLVVDHIYPVHLGGVTALRNLVSACVDCNAGKSGLVLKDVDPADEVFPLTPSLARYLTYEEAAYVLQMTVEQFERFWEPRRDAAREILEKRWADVKLQN